MTFFKTLAVSISFLFLTGEQGEPETEIIYGRHDGMALTMTLIKPSKPNGKAVISLLSGGFFSDYARYDQYRDRTQPFLDAGYTVFLVQHRSASRYAIPDALADVQRSVQFIRLHAKEYGIDAAKIGITGTSSGGHLSLLAAMSDDIGDEASKDPVEKQSSKVQAVAVFCPPTDFMNYGAPGETVRKRGDWLKMLRLENAFQYTEFNFFKNGYVPMAEDKIAQTDSLMSPALLVTPDDPPVYICHGDADDLVPMQQSEKMISELKKKKIPSELIVKKGAGHGWPNMNDDEAGFVAWFAKHLK